MRGTRSWLVYCKLLTEPTDTAGCGWHTQENPDLFKWLTGQLEPPERLMKNPVFVVRRIKPSRCARGCAKPFSVGWHGCHVPGRHMCSDCGSTLSPSDRRIIRTFCSD